MVGGQLLPGRRGAEVRIAGADQPQHLLAYGIGQRIAGPPPGAARNQPRGALYPKPGHQALDLPYAQTQLPGRLALTELPVDNLLYHPQPVHGLLCHRNGLLCHGPSSNPKGTS